jgi:hypothetical protein
MTHLAASGQFLGPLSDEALARLLDLLVVRGAGRPGVGALLNAWPTFVALAVRQTRWPDLKRLLDAVIGQADRWFQEAGLWTERIESDGRRVRVLTGQATEAGPLAEALVWASLGVSVPDQVLALHGSGEHFEELLDKLAGVHHVVGGLDMAGWADGLSGYFEDQGYALNIMLNNLRQGKRARSWGNQ